MRTTLQACSKLLIVAFGFLVHFTFYAQTPFTATYSFAGANGDTQSMPYNGVSYAGLSIGPVAKVGVTSNASNNNFRATQWPLGATTGSNTFTGSVDLGKYIEFSVAPIPGYVYTITSISFGLGRSGTGTRQFQWRGSHDNFGVAINNYTALNASLTNSGGVLTNPDTNNSWSGNTLNLGALYANKTTTSSFRFYMYNAEGVFGTAGLNAALIITGTYEPAVVNVNPSLQNTTLASISSTMSAVPYSYPGAQSIGYRFLITNKTATPNVSTELLSSSRFFSLTQAGIAAYDSEYEIKATALINGEVAPHNGNTITVFTPSAATIPLTSFTCGTQLSRLNATISATPAFGATAYRFRIRLSSDTEEPTYGYSQSSSRFVSAGSFALESNAPFVLNYENSYAVAVQYLLLNNGVEAWTEFGSECTITTPAIPLIAMASPSCGSQVASFGATISAQAATNANQYRFRIRLTSETEEPIYGYTLPTSSRFSQLSAFQDFTLDPGTSYSVAAEYRLMNNGEELWSGFGAECAIVTPGEDLLLRPEAPVESLVAGEAFTTKAYPNPFRDSFSLEIKANGTAPIQVVVYDMTGRLLEHKTMTVDQANSTPIGYNYPSGVYQVVVSQGDALQTVRVIKQ